MTRTNDHPSPENAASAGLDGDGERPQPSQRLRDVQEVALTLFAQLGYEGTAMSHIAKQLGIRVPTLYSHIQAKQELLAEIMTETSDAVWREFEEAVEGIDDPSERLRKATHTYVSRHLRHPREALVVNRDLSSLEEPTLSTVIEVRRRHADAIRDIVKRGCDTGVFHARSPRLASFAILEMGVSVARWFSEDGPLSADEVAREYSDYAVALARCRAKPPARAARR